MNRRPLKSRASSWTKALAAWLVSTAVTPNQISIASMVFAALAGGAFFLGGLWLIAAALFIQLRLLCNLLDGMVAVEGGKSTPDGPFWNEAPDRISDILIITGLGYGIGLPELGWAAAAMAILTAYIRELGSSTGQAADFCGPMAKPQRMAWLTGAALLAAIGPNLLDIALWVLLIGTGITALRRSFRLVRALKNGA
ncbi:MAG: CDP-alcohol phosphatidyltransferase family protein [Rhodobacteraceae bacterium]|nr:CDP-alcohol phosphatidyltransferase family protein [Paracoccaceae bacterium]